MFLLTDLPASSRFYIACNRHELSEHESDEPCQAPTTSPASGEHRPTTRGYTDAGRSETDATATKDDTGGSADLIIGQSKLEIFVKST